MLGTEDALAIRIAIAVKPDCPLRYMLGEAVLERAGREGLRCLAGIAHAIRGGAVLDALRGASGPDAGALRDAVLHARQGTLGLLTYAPASGSRADLAVAVVGWRHEDLRSVPGTWVEGRLDRTAGNARRVEARPAPEWITHEIGTGRGRSVWDFGEG